jgi:pantoate--beta-alanine ligase
MRVVRRIVELRDWVGGRLVPTMGALHKGHAQLIRRATADTGAGPLIVSVFVNPTQFNDPADLQRYPRTLEADIELCARAGADVVFAPEVSEMYPPEGVPVPALPATATEPGLEDAHRPGHFAGVCQVVARLFDLCRPVVTYFGEKDWQQYCVIREMVAMQGRALRVVGVPTVREPDGLAMSSRNRFLSASARRSALAISAALRAALARTGVHEAVEAMRSELARPGREGGEPVHVEYAVIREAETLRPVETSRPGSPTRALIAARVGGVRLIDNAPWHCLPA